MSPILNPGVTLDAASNAPSTQWNTEKTRAFISGAINCRFDGAPNENNFFLIIMVVSFFRLETTETPVPRDETLKATLLYYKFQHFEEPEQPRKPTKTTNTEVLKTTPDQKTTPFRRSDCVSGSKIAILREWSSANRHCNCRESWRFWCSQLLRCKLYFQGRKTHPKKTTHPNEKSLRKQFPGLFVRIVLPLSFKLNKRYAERVWANCLPKLFSVGFIGVGGFLGWVFLP